jgi:hypothetical protein
MTTNVHTGKGSIFFTVLAIPFDYCQEWSKRVKTNFYILFLNLKHLTDHSSYTVAQEEESIILGSQ